MLDIVNIAHPAFIILGSYIAYIVNIKLGIDPIIVSIIMLPAFYALGAAIYRIYYQSFEKRGQESLRGLAFFFGVLFVTEVVLILAFGVDYRYVEAAYIGPTLSFSFVDLPLRILVPFLVSLALFGALQLFISRTFTGRAILAVSQDQVRAAADGRRPDPHQAHRLRHLDRDRGGSGRAPYHHPAGRAFGRPRIYRPRVCHLRSWRSRQPARHADCGASDRCGRKHHRDILRTVLGAGGIVRLPAADARVPPLRIAGALTVRMPTFILVAFLVATVVFVLLSLPGIEYLFVAGYIVVQYVVLATAWNILGGYTGYVNFGSAAFFAIGAYSSVALITFGTQLEDLLPESLASPLSLIFPLPIPVLIVVSGAVSGLVGFGMGYLTLRLRGAFFAIATLALAVVLQTLVVNWDFVGGSSGAYVVRPSIFTA